jgi:hypothetical protein
VNALRALAVISLLAVVPACSAPHHAGGASAFPSAQHGAADVKPLPFNAGGLLKGTATPSLPAGDPGKVSVVQIGPLDKDASGSAKLPIAFRNNTPDGISHVDWAGTARSGGAIVATGSSQGTIPAQVRPGEIGLAFIFFQVNTTLPPEDAKYDFTVNSVAANTNSYNTAPLRVTEVNPGGDSLVGGAVNDTGKKGEGPFAVSVYCFDGDNIKSEHGGFAEQQGPLSPGGQATFTVTLYGAPCPTFAVGVSGYFSD